MYEGNVYRPPSEAYSLIVQATIGCSHNTCTFCSMYRDKKFRIRKTDEVISDLSMAKDITQFDKIFLADGDALIIKTRDLKEILTYIRENIPGCTRVGVYGSPQSILLKPLEELLELKALGLGIIYTGLESGSDTVLKKIKKGFTAQEIIEAGLKVKEAGILFSVTVISGLGGRELWYEHAEETGRALSKMNPSYIGLLTLMLEDGTELYEDYQKGVFQNLTPDEVALETLVMLQNLDSEGSIFRANHASNYLSLKGTLNADKERMVSQLKLALDGKLGYKPERYRLL